MLTFKDIMVYVRDLFKMNTVYDCVRPFLAVSGIFGVGGSNICEIDGVRSVRNTRFSLIVAVFLALIFMPATLFGLFKGLFSGEQRPLATNISMILLVGKYAFITFTVAAACIQTHVYCKNLTKVLQILHNTDLMLKEENIHVNYWGIILTTILLGLVSFCYKEVLESIYFISLHLGPLFSGAFIFKTFIDITCDIYFIWIIIFVLIIRERFAGVNRLLQQNAQGSHMHDSSLLTRLSLARDIHDQLSEAIVVLSDLSRVVIVGMLVSSMLDSLGTAITVLKVINQFDFKFEDEYMTIARALECITCVVQPLMKIVSLTAVCETHKNDRRVLTSRLRQLIAFEQDPRIVHQLKQYILFNHSTVAGLIDFQLIDIDFTLLFLVIDIIVSYLFVIHSYFR